MRGHALTVNAIELRNLTGGVRAKPLPLPINLIDLKSEQGQKSFHQSESLAAYFPLAINFVTQENPAYCGVATMVMS